MVNYLLCVISIAFLCIAVSGVVNELPPEEQPGSLLSFAVSQMEDPINISQVSAVSGYQTPLLSSDVHLTTGISSTGSYWNHTIEFKNSCSYPVWVNVIAGPHGTFQEGTDAGKDCAPTDCGAGNVCCPSTRCQEAKCGTTICNKEGLPLPAGGGFKLEDKTNSIGNVNTITVTVPDGVLGDLTAWGRTWCTGTDDSLVCDTAGCNMIDGKTGKLLCGGFGSNFPATKAEITFQDRPESDGSYQPDYYDVSLVDGYNLPVQITHTGVNETAPPGMPADYWCTAAGGTADLNSILVTSPVAPKSLAFNNSTSTVVGVYSACKYSVAQQQEKYKAYGYQNPEYCCCCESPYDQPLACSANVKNWPSDVQSYDFFKKYYPYAYGFAYNDGLSTFHCKPQDKTTASSYLIEFCGSCNSASSEYSATYSITKGTPVQFTHDESGVTLTITPSDNGTNHVVHLEVYPETEPPEAYKSDIPTLGQYYYIHSTIPSSIIDTTGITISYTDSLVPVGFNEDALRIFRYDEMAGRWTALPGSVDTITNIVSGISEELGHFTIGVLTDGTTGEIPISQGWNFVSTPGRLAPGNNTAIIFDGVDTGGHSLLSFEPGTGWRPLQGSDPILPLEGLWIFSNQTTTVPLIFDPDPISTPPSRLLSAGWTCIGHSCTLPATTRDTLLSVQDSWAYCIGFNASVQQYDIPIINGGSGLFTDQREMMPHQGYWLYMNTTGILAGISAGNT